LFTALYNWVQKFLSTKRERFSGGLRPFFEQVRQQRQTRMIFLTAMILPASVVFVLTVLLPAARTPFDEITHPNTIDAVAQNGEALPPALVEKYAALKVDAAYWQARLKLAKSNAIQLAIDLRDSVVSLDIRGVSVHQAKIHKFKISRAVKRLQSQKRLHAWLTNGFTLQKEMATLPKAPIRIKEAPRDTIEASESSGEELEIENRDVHFTWHFDRQLTVFVEQVQMPSFTGMLSKGWYNFRRSLGGAGEAILSLAQLKIPRHRLWIELELPRDDAKAIYRALPKHAGLALRL
jgi:hypothetical protein